MKDPCKFIRTPMNAVDVSEVFNRIPVIIPALVEVKEFMRKYPEEPYAIPAFVDQNSSVIALRFKTRKKHEQMLTLINPGLLSTQGFMLNEESQYGVEGSYLVPRHPRIEVMYVSLPKGEAVRQELVGKAALVFQQAFQALSGVYICDIGMRVDNDEAYKNATDEEKQEIARAYLDYLKEENETAMSEDANIKKYVEATEFLADRVETSIMKEEALMNLAAAGKEVPDGQENAEMQKDSSVSEQSSD